MKSEQIKEITEKATEHLVAALNAGRSEALTSYLKAIGRFHHYSLHNVMLIASQKTERQFRRWFPYVEPVGPLREEGRERHRDPRSHRSPEGGERRGSARGFDLRCRFSRCLRVRCQPDRWPGIAAHWNRARPPTRISRTPMRLRGGAGNFRRILFGDRARAWNIERRPHHAASRPVGGGGVLNACARTGPRTPAPGRSPRRHIASNPRNRSGSNGVCRLSRYRAGNRPLPTTSSCGTEMPNSLPRASATSGRRRRKCSPRSRMGE